MLKSIQRENDFVRNSMLGQVTLLLMDLVDEFVLAFIFDAEQFMFQDNLLAVKEDTSNIF